MGTVENYIFLWKSLNSMNTQVKVGYVLHRILTAELEVGAGPR